VESPAKRGAVLISIWFDARRQRQPAPPGQLRARPRVGQLDSGAAADHGRSPCTDGALRADRRGKPAGLRGDRRRAAEPPRPVERGHFRERIRARRARRRAGRTRDRLGQRAGTRRLGNGGGGARARPWNVAPSRGQPDSPRVTSTDVGRRRQDAGSARAAGTGSRRRQPFRPGRCSASEVRSA
jgi:hypothetical protein